MSILLTVSELTENIKSLLESSFSQVYVKGEVSNLTKHSSGHKYFSIKDSSATIRCVMWKGRTFPSDIKEGSKVNIFGSLSLYPKSGSYQINCLSIKKLGIGDLYEEYLKLKAKLQKEGLFDTEFKLPINRFPKKVAIITSPTSAAAQDIMSTFARRAPQVRLVMIPTLMQGEGSDIDVIKSLKKTSSIGNIDTIIIARGGGSIEDLWSFNSEELAYKIYECKIPIISGIGHESDFTICDFVADKRAPTPTGAAEMCTPITVDELIQTFDFYDIELKKSIRREVNINKERLGTGINESILNSLKKDFKRYHDILDSITLSFDISVSNDLRFKKERLNNISLLLDKSNPINILKEGYLFVGKYEKLSKGEKRDYHAYTGTGKLEILSHE
ncbi:MAG: exodeoxyribonuclease VII large subunit [Candidatus Kapaibacteriales bacterium]